MGNRLSKASWGRDRTGCLRDFNLSGSTSAWTNRSVACLDLVRLSMRTAVPRCTSAGAAIWLGFGGTWFPESEYDTEVDRAISWLSKGRTPEDTAARTVRYLERDWGVQVQTGKQEQLAQGLGHIDMSDFTTR